MSRPSVILLGSKPGSVVALEVLLSRGWDVRGVVVSPSLDRPWIGGPTLADFAARHGLRVLTQSELEPENRADFVISYMYRYRVKEPVIAAAERAALNFHAGPLPEFAGWAFYNVAILEGRDEFGCTCHYMDAGFDTGPLLRVRRFPIDPTQETAVTLESRAQEEMVRLFIEFCELAESGDPLPREDQDPAKMRYMTQDEFMALKRIPDEADATTVDRHARAFWYPPYECAYFERGGSRIEVVPAIAKEQLAPLLHAQDYGRLRTVATDVRAVEIVGDVVTVRDREGEHAVGIGTPEGFKVLSDLWLRSGWDAKYVYSFTWMGRPIIQLPEDMVRLQEVIYRVQPDVIIETGVAHGGSLVFYASLCKALGRGRVVGIDIDIRSPNRAAIEAHPLAALITLIEGDSTDPEIVARATGQVRPGETVMVLLDAAHTKQHVLRELEAYGPLVTMGSYIVAMDGIMGQLAGAPRSAPDWVWNNPRQAALQFASDHPEFVIDEPAFAFNEGSVTSRTTYWPDAFLRRLS